MEKDDIIENNIIKGCNNFIIKIKSMRKKDWMQTLAVYFIIIMVCVMFFAIGYGKAYQNTVEVANKIIVELIKSNSQQIDMYGIYSVNIPEYTLNMPSQILEKTGG